jgi:hypothetical protein
MEIMPVITATILERSIASKNSVSETAYNHNINWRSRSRVDRTGQSLMLPDTRLLEEVGYLWVPVFKMINDRLKIRYSRLNYADDIQSQTH